MPEDQYQQPGSPSVAGVLLAPQLDAIQQRIAALELASAENQQMIQHLQGDSGTLENLSFFSAWRRTDTNAAGTTPPAASFVGQAQLWLAGSGVTFTRVAHTPYMEVSVSPGACYDYVVDAAGGGTHTTVRAMMADFLAAVTASGNIVRSCWLCNDDTDKNIEWSIAGSTPVGTLIIEAAGPPNTEGDTYPPRASLILNISSPADGDAYFKSSAGGQLPNMLFRNVGIENHTNTNATYFILFTQTAPGVAQPQIKFESVKFDMTGANSVVVGQRNSNSSMSVEFVDCTGQIGSAISNGDSGDTSNTRAFSDFRWIGNRMTIDRLIRGGAGATPLNISDTQLTVSTRLLGFVSGNVFSVLNIANCDFTYTGTGIFCQTQDAQIGTREITLHSIRYQQSSAAATAFNFSGTGSGTDTLYIDDVFMRNYTGTAGTAITVGANFNQVTVGVVQSFGFTTTTSLPTGALAGVDHHTLSDLTTGDDHTQYALLIGRGSPLGSPFGGYLSAAGAALPTYHTTVAGLSPVGYWRMNETSGNVTDYSGNGNTMTPQISGAGALTYRVAGKMSGQYGISGYATGANKTYLHAADAASLHVGDVFSIVASIKKGSNGTYQTILDSGAPSGVHGFEFRVNNANRLSLAADGSLEMCTSTTTITDANWHLVAATKTGATIKLYIDGTDVSGAVTNVTITDANLGFSIGHANSVDFDAFSGTLSEVSLYSVALSAANITSLYNAWTATTGVTPTNTQDGDITALRLNIGNVAFVGTTVFNVTGDSLLSGYMRLGSLAVPTNTTAGDFTAVRILAGDATLASGVVLAAAGNETITGYLGVGSATAPNNVTAGDFTSLRLVVGTAAPAITAGVVNVTGDSLLSGYLRVGSLTAPTNTTVGDVTAGRIHIGTDGGFTTGSILELLNTDTATASGARVLSGFSLKTNAASNSAAELRVMNFEFQPQASVNYTVATGSSGIVVLYRRQAGTGTDTAFNAFTASGPLVGSGALTTFNAYNVFNGNANAGLNRAFYSPHKAYEVTYGGKSIRIPSASQTISAAGNTILADATVEMISNTSGGSITLTSAPTIADGTDGQIITILNVGTANVVIQDQGSLANSNLRLTGASVTIAPRNSVTLLYSATVGDWVQIGNLVVVL